MVIALLDYLGLKLIVSAKNVGIVSIFVKHISIFHPTHAITEMINTSNTQNTSNNSTQIITLLLLCHYYLFFIFLHCLSYYYRL